MAFALVVAGALLLAHEVFSRADINVILVTNTGDSGPGSLRAAILEANGTPVIDEIRFAFVPDFTMELPPTPVIYIYDALPPITTPVIINGAQTGVSGPGVQLVGVCDCEGLGPDGLVFDAGSGGSTVTRMSLVGFTRAIVLGSDGNTVTGNYVGLDLGGSADANGTGVAVTGARNTVGRGNVISNNFDDGVAVSGSDNVVAGNLIGLDSAGTAAAPNSGSGVYVGVSAGGNRIGGSDPADRNVISANQSFGIYIDSTTTGNSILGNFVGTNKTGSVAIGNNTGIVIEDSPGNVIGAVGAGNVIAGNFGAGITLENAGGSIVRANMIGTDAAGTATGLGNESDGIRISGSTMITIGGAGAGEGNVIVDNGSDGIDARFVGTLTVQGNSIGLGSTGAANGNWRNGIRLEATTDAQIGGAGSAGNVLSANVGAGLNLACGFGDGTPIPDPSGTTVEGNRIGTDRAAALRRGNLGGGITVDCGTGTHVGGKSPALGNYISANGDSEGVLAGLFDAGTDDTIQNNFIGVGAGGENLGNVGAGVSIGSSFPDVIDNTIAYNSGNGVEVVVGTNNLLRGNRIHDNGLLGIDLGSDGVTANDAGDVDGGPNLRQNFPVLTGAVRSGTSLLVSGTLSSVANTDYTVELFANTAADPSGFGEGETPLGTTTVHTNGSGVATFTNVAVALPAAAQRLITATATDPVKNTSELSAPATTLTAPTMSTTASANVLIGGTVHDTANVAGGDGPTGSVVFTLYGPDDATCASSSPPFTSTVAVAGNGAYDSAAFTPTAPGVYRWVARYGGDSRNTSVQGSCNDPNEAVTIIRIATPTLTTTASPNGPIGQPITDVATIAGGSRPSGTLVFRLFGPDNASCAGAPVFSSTKPVAGNGAVTSDPFTPTALGTYRWVAAYSGDAGNAPVSGACGDANEQVVIGKAVPALTTVASASVPVGGVLSDSATLANGFNPGGTLTFRLFGPTDPTCTNPPLLVTTAPVSGNGTYASGSFTTATPGTYRWVASYPGDANNNPAGGACGDPSETVVVTLAVPTISTQSSLTAMPGQPMVDTAKVAGGFNPTGTVTFRLYGATDPSCGAAPIYTSTNPLTAGGAAVSGAFTAPAPGTYRWIATYNGDANNRVVPGVCGDASETVTVLGTTTTSAPTTTTSTTIPVSTTSTTTSTTTTSTTTTTVDPGPDTPPPTIDTTIPPTTTTTPPSTTSTTVSQTTTSLPPGTTTTATTAPPAVTPTTTATPPTATTAAPTTPPTTAPPAETSTSAPTTVPASTTAPPATTTTRPPATTTTAPAPPTTAPPAASLDAVNPRGERSGPAGVALDVSGDGYTGCPTVYFFFDGVRIGSDTPNAAGSVGVGHLSVPGDAEPGQHRVTSACRPSGGPVRASSAFVVTKSDVHRSAFVTSLNRPDQVSLDLSQLATSAIVAVALIVLFAFPFELFNSTVEENYDEIRGWFRLPARVVGAGTRASRIATFLGLTVLTAIVIGFLSPDFGLNLTSAVLVIGFTVALLVMSLGFSLPAAIGIHRSTGEWGTLNFLPGTVVVSIIMVALSRAFHFQPGYMYGALAGLAFASALSRETQGRLTAANWIWALALSVGAWLVRIPVANAAARPGASVWWVGAEACLVLIFLWGVEGLAVAMLPMRFLDGRKVIDWNRVVWAVLLFMGVFAAVHVLFAPSSGYVGHTTGQVTVGVVALFLIFGGISVGLWAYFRYRPERATS